MLFAHGSHPGVFADWMEELSSADSNETGLGSQRGETLTLPSVVLEARSSGLGNFLLWESFCPSRLNPLETKR